MHAWPWLYETQETSWVCIRVRENINLMWKRQGQLCIRLCHKQDITKQSFFAYETESYIVVPEIKIVVLIRILMNVRNFRDVKRMQ